MLFTIRVLGAVCLALMGSGCAGPAASGGGATSTDGSAGRALAGVGGRVGFGGVGAAPGSGGTQAASGGAGVTAAGGAVSTPGQPACIASDSGVVPGVTHAVPAGAWITDTTFPFSGAGPHVVRQFDVCAATATGDAQACFDTIDYVDQAGQTRRLPYRVSAPRDLGNSADRLPVVVFQHGGGPNPVGQRAYDNYAKFLASHGYIVVQTAVMPACGAASACNNSPLVLAAYCNVYGQVSGADCAQMNIMYFNRPNDFRATITALPRIFATIDRLSGNQSLNLASLADPELVALSGHSAGTNGVLSLAGAGFDYVGTPAGTNVNQQSLFPTAFVAMGPNADSSDGGHGWDAAGFSQLSANTPFLFLSGSRDYAKDVPACDRPQAFFSAGLGAKFFHYEVGGTHASIAMNDEDNTTVDAISQLWTPDRCAPNTSAVRGADDFGLPRGMGASTTPFELSIYGSTEAAVLTFLDAELKNDSAMQSALQALPENTGNPANFAFSTSSFQRRGPASPDAKFLGPSAVTVGGACGNTIQLRLLRRGLNAAVTPTVEGLPAAASATISPFAADATQGTLLIERGAAPAGEYLVRIKATGALGPVLGTEILVRFP